MRLSVMHHPCYLLLALLCVCALAQSTAYVPPLHCNTQKTKQDCEDAFNNCAWCAVTHTCAEWNACKHEPRNPALKVCTFAGDKHYGWSLEGVTACSTATAWAIFLYVAVGLAAVCGCVWLSLVLLECARKRCDPNASYEALE